MNEELILSYQSEFELYFKDLIANQSIPSSNLKEAISYSLFPGGKRIRPLLVYLSGFLFNLDKNCLNILAASIELIHCYSLIHDDLPAMDDDDFRRGRPSLHKAFDEATAILAGDALQTLAFEILLHHLPQYLSDKQTIEISLELAKASGISGMIAGQDLDLTLLNQDNLKEEDLNLIHLLKTGKLITAASNMVLIAAEANEQEIEALRTYTDHLGLVFQIQDDYLDCYVKDALGKRRASDLANNKKTFASFYDKSSLVELIYQHFTKAKEALTIFKDKKKPLLLLTEKIEQRSSGKK